MRREEYKLHSNNFTNTLLETLKDTIPTKDGNNNHTADLRRLNDVWAAKLKSTRIVEASIFKHLHSELANISFVSPITQQHSNKCKSFLSETQSSLTNETFYLGRLLEFRKLPHLKDLREASGKKSSTPTKTNSTIVDSGQDLFEILSQSFEAAELYSKQSRVMTNDQLEKQIRCFTTLILNYVKTQEEKDKLNNLIHSSNNTSGSDISPKESKNKFNDINRVPVSSSCPSLGPNNRIPLNLIPQMAELAISSASPTKIKSGLDPYFHSKELKLSVAGENSKNILEFKTHLRRVIYQCFSDLASSWSQEKENLDDVRSLGVLFDRSRVYLFEFILTNKFCTSTNSTQPKSPTILIDAVGVNYTNGGQGIALVFTTLLQYLRDGWKKLCREPQDPLPTLHLSLLKFVYQLAKKDIQTASSGNLNNSATTVTSTSLHSKSTSDLSSSMAVSEPQVLSPSYSPTLNASIGSLLFNAVHNNSNYNNTIDKSPIRCNVVNFTSNMCSPESSQQSSPQQKPQQQQYGNTTLSDNAFLTSPLVHNSCPSLDFSISSPPPPMNNVVLVSHNFGSPTTNCKSSALSAEQQRAINSIGIVSRTASTRATSIGNSHSTGNLATMNSSNSSTTNLQSPKRHLLSTTTNMSSASTSSLPISSTSGPGVSQSTKGMRLLQRSKAILSDATNFNYFDKFKNVVSPGGGSVSNKEQQQTSPTVGGLRGLMKGRKPIVE